MVSFLKKHKRLSSFAGLLIFFLLVVGNSFKNPVKVLETVDASPIQGEVGVARVVEAGWSVPIKLKFNDEGWEDSSYITRDGRHILFFYHPGNQFDEKSANSADGRIYFSERPFVEKRDHPVSGSGFSSEGGPYISENGDFYYMKTFMLGRKLRVMKNGRDLDLESGAATESNPHYCDTKDELYFDAPDGQKIAMYKNGKTVFLPETINRQNTQNLQPFLTDDCQTLYFTSTRGAWEGVLPLQIYRSRRLDENSWSEPGLFVSFPQLGGVGEFSMTKDGRQLVFTQMSRGSDGVFRNNIYYAEKH